VVVASDVAAENEAVAAACGGLAVEVDVRDEEAVRSLVARALETYGTIDVLVAAAGLDVRRSPAREDRYVVSVPLADWRTVLDVNLTGTFLSIRTTLPHMLERRAGSIITFTSGTVSAPLPGLGAYVSSKAGIEGLTRVLALEVAAHGVRANLLQPGGPTDTPFFEGLVDAEERARMHEPGVIRACAVYLASDGSSGVTGQSLVAADWNRERGLRLCGCPACSA
jgi:NAD(P)-dependent dehydrogenase (short-subunit alcohol dehydrogenase family)